MGLLSPPDWPHPHTSRREYLLGSWPFLALQDGIYATSENASLALQDFVRMQNPPQV